MAQPFATVHLDLDGGVHVYRAHGWRYDAHDDPLFETGLAGALELFGAAGVRATLFVIAEDLANPRKRELIVDAIRRGHSIGSHTTTHRNLTTLTRDEKCREIAGSRERLAQALGVEVQGFRAPGFAIDRESLELVAEAGYEFDSSLFPTKRVGRHVDLPCPRLAPYRLLMGKPLLELPMPAYSPLPYPFHPSYSLVLGEWYFRLGLRIFRRTGAPLVCLFHLTDFADPLPPALLPNRRARIFTLSHLSRESKLRRCRRMLDLVAHDYTITTTAAIG